MQSTIRFHSIHLLNHTKLWHTYLRSYLNNKPMHIFITLLVESIVYIKALLVECTYSIDYI